MPSPEGYSRSEGPKLVPKRPFFRWRTYHSDGGAESSLVGEGGKGLEAGELMKRPGIGAESPAATERSGGPGSYRQRTPGGCGGSRRCMCQRRHGAHRGSGGVGRGQHGGTGRVSGQSLEGVNWKGMAPNTWNQTPRKSIYIPAEGFGGGNLGETQESLRQQPGKKELFNSCCRFRPRLPKSPGPVLSVPRLP